MPVIPVLGKQGQEIHSKFQARKVYLVASCLKIHIKHTKHNNIVQAIRDRDSNNYVSNKKIRVKKSERRGLERWLSD